MTYTYDLHDQALFERIRNDACKQHTSKTQSWGVLTRRFERVNQTFIQIEGRGLVRFGGKELPQLIAAMKQNGALEERARQLPFDINEYLADLHEAIRTEQYHHLLKTDELRDYIDIATTGRSDPSTTSLPGSEFIPRSRTILAIIVLMALESKVSSTS